MGHLMQTIQKLSLALVVQALMIPASFAHKQTSEHSFLEDTHANITMRNAWIDRDKKDPGVKDTSSWGQAFVLDLDTGFTPGIIGFGAGVVGDVGFKIGDNKHHGNDMLPFHPNTKSDKYPNNKPYNSWARGGANVKAKISETTVRYGTQIVDLPVLQSNVSARLLPEYYTGTLINSKEIEGLDLSAGYFTKNQFSTQINTDGGKLRRAVVWGGNYKVNDQFKFGYYGADLKDALNRHYINANFKQPLANEDSLTFDLNAYHTKYEKDIYNDISYAATGPANEDKKNTIWALSGAYNTGPHNIMLAYQQNSGDVGYVYNVAAAGGGSIYMPNSYLSDFVGNGEKSVQIQYSLDFGKLGVLPGLNWTTAYVYGWDINVKNVTDDAREREFFNQVSYKVQSGPAKDLSLKVRNSIYRAGQDYSSDYYIGSTNEWRVFAEYPFSLF